MVLVTGATGYVGGRLVPRLLESGRPVRVLARDPARLAGRPWIGRVEVVRGDVHDPVSLAPALAGVDVAYYLVHSMADHDAFATRDRDAARAFGEAARAAGVRRIVYLGGLGAADDGLSDHLRSRQETGDALRAAGVPVTELRAAVIVGSGSISFEMIRWLVERLPVMICPRWVYQRIQPIAIHDVLSYLVAAPDVPEAAGRVVEIGGSDVLTYREMMLVYAERRGLRRRLVPVPVLTPRLSSHWVRWMTPVPASVARPLVEGLRNEVIVRDDSALRLFPSIRPLSYREALDRAFEKLDRGEVETAWS
ncbi:MAG TPA: NAD(P)H-binding protein, partial [Anaeromyxobacteraceae bacterium]|nr:NAD(P)H-binding protein [Anaeromyxobacteraceae bacterium]